MIKRRIDRFLSWVSKHYHQFIGSPTNGHRSISDADVLLKEMSAGRRRICKTAEKVVADNDTAERLIGDGDVSGVVRS